MNRLHIRGLLWKEWTQHETEITGIVAVWLIGVWILPLGPHVFLFPFGIIAALRLGHILGASDAVEGTEEFAFALPPTREQRFLVRLALGGVFFLALQGLAVAAYALNAPQALWGLLFQSGMRTPFAEFQPGYLYVLALVIPLAFFAEAFSVGMLAPNPLIARTAALRGLIPLALAGGVVMFCKAFGVEQIAPTAAVVVLLAVAALRLVAAGRAYRSKEGVSQGPAAAASGSKLFWIIVAILVSLILTSFVLFLGTSRSAASMQPQPPSREGR